MCVKHQSFCVLFYILHLHLQKNALSFEHFRSTWFYKSRTKQTEDLRNIFPNVLRLAFRWKTPDDGWLYTVDLTWQVWVMHECSQTEHEVAERL